VIGILIRYNDKTMFAGLPKDDARLKKQLENIGVTVSLHDIRLSDKNDIGYEIQIFTQTSVDLEVVSRISGDDTLGKLNDLMAYVERNDQESILDRITDSGAGSVSKLYEEMRRCTVQPEPDKLIIRTTMEYKKRYYEPVDCIVEKAIVVSHDEYSALINVTENCYDFIAENQEYMYYDNDNNRHCLLVCDEKSGDGVLINSEGYNYARYSAFVPNAREVIEQYELEKSGLKTVKAPITESEKRLLDIISKSADRIATLAYLGHRDFMIGDTLKELDCSMNDINDLLINAIAQKVRKLDGISDVKVSDLNIPLQPEITVKTEENESLAADEELSGLSL
jgi:hypothetical protein